MKKDIHPQYMQATITCMSCGSTFIVGSTKSALKIELCSKCHPFYGGEQRIVDTQGRVERFKKRYKLE